MADDILHGSCLCKSVTFEVTPPFMRFAHCYCSRCRKATGGTRSTNIAVPVGQFRWTSGEDLVSRYDMPEARSFGVTICSRCKCPVPRITRDGERAVIPSGTLDDEPTTKPSEHRYWSSRVDWVELDESDLPCSD